MLTTPQGRLADALSVLEESNRLIAQRGFRDHQTTYPRNALAEAYLVAAERAEGAERQRALRRAKHACGVAVRHGRIFRGGVPYAARLGGTYAWLTGRAAAARRWWARSVRVAEALGARYDLGVTHLEIGRRTGSRRDLERAAVIFEEIGACLDARRARELLG